MDNISKELMTKEEAIELIDPRIVGLPLTIENLCDEYADYYLYEEELEKEYAYNRLGDNGYVLEGESLAMLPVYRNVQLLVNTIFEKISLLYEALELNTKIIHKTSKGTQVLVTKTYGEIVVQLIEDLEDTAL